MNPSILPEGFQWEIYMPICCRMIDACDCIYMLSNWQDSKGARLELEYAKSKNKMIAFEFKNISEDNPLDVLSQAIAIHNTFLNQ